MKPRPALAALVVLLLLPCAAASGLSLSITELDANASLAFIGSNPLGGLVDPMLGIAPLLGASVPLRLSGPFFFEPGLEFLGWYYDWTGSNAQITQAENGSGFFTIGALLSFQAGASLTVSPVISVGAALGLDLLLRFPFELQNTAPSVKTAQGDALAWFYGGRFIYPETRFFLRWHLTEPVDLVFNLRAFYPVFHLWDGSGQPFWDALMVSGGVGFAVQLGKPSAPQGAAPAAEAPQPSSPQAK
jgi:hypothetical protein